MGQRQRSADGWQGVGESALRGKYDPFTFREPISEADLEVTDDVFLISREAAEAYVKRQLASQGQQPSTSPLGSTTQPGDEPSQADGTGGPSAEPPAEKTPDVVPGFHWIGDITPHKWMNFYTKVLAGFAAAKGLKLSLTVDVQPEGGVSKAKIAEMKVALRELGMSEDVHVGRTYDPRRTE